MRSILVIYAIALIYDGLLGSHELLNLICMVEVILHHVHLLNIYIISTSGGTMIQDFRYDCLQCTIRKYYNYTRTQILIDVFIVILKFVPQL